MKKAFWIWYPGDFEIYHGMKQNFSREERGFNWPAFWYIEDCRKNVKFCRSYLLTGWTAFTVYSHADGYVDVNGKKYRFHEQILCGPGKVEVTIHAGMITGVPSVYIEGEEIYSDREWWVEDYVSAPVGVGYSPKYDHKEQNPSIWEYDSLTVSPVEIKEIAGGVLYDFDRELTAEIWLKYHRGFRPVLVCYGESETEALDIENCYYSQYIKTSKNTLRRRAFRYAFIPECHAGEIELNAVHQFVDIPVRGDFSCGDELINHIWEASCETFRLCSGIFFTDGIKRDRWIWSGDAYQSYMINQYLMFDEEISKRTIWALRGNDPVRQHVNTIVDYSMYWVMGVYKHYEIFGDMEFVRAIFPKTESMMEFLGRQLDENGFITGRPGDWIFIDWAEELDKEGAVCAEQILLSMCYHAMWKLEEVLGNTDSSYREKYFSLKNKIDLFFWNEKKGAYIDSFKSGRENVSRHANLFAVLFGQADEDKRGKICENVIYNDEIPKITTPFFKFYELEALCCLGKKKEVLERIRAYWGGMIKAGAGTIWEEYDPNMEGVQHLAMYGDPYGKSLCHAWGATPIYILGRYFMGVEPTSPGYGTFQVRPETGLFSEFSCEVPIKYGCVKILWDGSVLTVLTDRKGGTLYYEGERYELKENEKLSLKKTV